jgi:DNA-binding PadR family transcriptional regulator
MYDEIRVRKGFRIDLEALVLATLQGEALHGYEIAKRLKQSGSSALSVGEGLLYPALHKLERDGYVAAKWIAQEGKPSRKVYSLTEKGERELEVRRGEWQGFAQTVSVLMAKPEVNRG